LSCVFVCYCYSCGEFLRTLIECLPTTKFECERKEREKERKKRERKNERKRKRERMKEKERKK
jgi:hypothetical protein